MPQPDPAALHNQTYTIVGNSVIGTLPTTAGKKRRRGEHGKDKSCATRRPNSRRCMTCVNNQGPHFATCTGRTGRGKCQYFSSS
eukprot:scaffold30053_cov183-Skeletonema_menzelii.AAC.1